MPCEVVVALRSGLVVVNFCEVINEWTEGGCHGVDPVSWTTNLHSMKITLENLEEPPTLWYSDL